MELAGSISPEVAAETDLLVEIRREMHRHPEVSFEEWRTADFIRSRLREYGIQDIRESVGTGTVAVLRGGRPGPTVLYRADIDGLPIQEENDVPYRSQNPGVMHACAHDGHIAIGLGVAKLAARHRDEMPGSLALVFQPAEERGSGAQRMLEEGALDGLTPDAAFGLHIIGDLPLGYVGVEDGGQFAGVTNFVLTVKGRGGHGAMPEQAVDPIVTAGYVITALQTIVSRNIRPFEPAVVTIGTIEGGIRDNVIPDSVTMTGTIRGYEDAVIERMIQRLEEIVRGVTSAMGAGYELEVDRVLPPVINDPEMARFVRERAAGLVGSDRVVGGRTTGGDDMGLFLRAAPGAYYVLGGRGKRPGGPHHSSTFDFDEACLPLGLELSWRIVRDYLEGCR